MMRRQTDGKREKETAENMIGELPKFDYDK